MKEAELDWCAPIRPGTTMESDEWLHNWTPLATDYGEYDPLRAGSIDGTDSAPHDHGIVRAMNAKYKPPKDIKGDPKHTIFVGRLNHSTTEETLRAIFSECGKIERLRLVRDIVTGRSKGYAFIEYQHTDEAEKAYHRCHKMAMDGSQIIVEFECERTLPGWVPRRMGGGFGGKKESGQLRFGGRDRPFKKPIMLGSKMLGSQERRERGGQRRTSSEWQAGRGDSGRRYQREAWSSHSGPDGHRHATRERYATARSGQQRERHSRSRSPR